MKMLVNPSFTVASAATWKRASAAPVPPEAALVTRRARHVMSVYERHFAGLTRASRDDLLLTDLLGWLEGCRSELVRLSAAQPVALAPHVLSVAGHVSLLAFELHQIPAARTGSAPGMAFGWLAERLDAQLDAYRVHFAGMGRLSRRHTLALRVQASAEQIVVELAAPEIVRDADSEDRLYNLGLATSLVDRATDEAAHIKVIQDRASVEDRMNALAAEGQRIIDGYVAHFGARAPGMEDRARLGEWCDQLGETERQLTSLVEHHPDDGARVVVERIGETLLSYEMALAEIGQR